MARAPSKTSKPLTDRQFHAVARALAEPRRFAILQQVATAETVACCNLREREVISPATISHHLKELSEAGLVSIVRQGRIASITLCRSVLDAYISRLTSL